MISKLCAVSRTFERAMPYICVDEAEVIRLPSFMQLLELPPAKEMPVVAVYKFNDLTGQRKECQTLHHFLHSHARWTSNGNRCIENCWL